MLKHRSLATAAAGVMFVYYLFCGLMANLFPEFSFRLYTLVLHGFKVTNLEVIPETMPEMLTGAIFYAVMTWIIVCSVGWIYNKVIKK